MNTQKKWAILTAVPLFTFLSIFYFYPLIRIFILSFSQDILIDDQQHQSVIAHLFSNSYYLKLIWFTFWQAGLSTFLTLILAVPGAYVFSHYEFKGKRILESIITIPFVLPTMVTAAAFQSLLGPRGIINSFLMHIFNQNQPIIDIDQTFFFFLLAHIFYNYVIVFRIVSNSWARLPIEISDAARVLGASQRHIFFKITLPMLYPAIIAAAILVFVFCFTSFGIILVLGGPRLATIEVEIFRQALHLFNLPMAASLSIIQLIFTFILMWLYTRIEHQKAVSYIPTLNTATIKIQKSWKDHLIIYLNILFIFALILAPLLSLGVSSFLTQSGFSFIYYKSLFINKAQSIIYVPPIIAMFNSFITALSAAFLALIMGFLGALFLFSPTQKKSSLLDPLFMLPLSTSAVTLGFGYIVALDRPPLNLRTSILLPIFAHALIGFPFVLRTILPVMKSIPRSLKEAAAILGASSLKVWAKIEVPILSRALTISFIFAFAISMGEFGATVFVARPQSPTLPLAIYRFLNYPGALNYGQAMAMSCLLMVTTTFGFFFLDKLKFHHPR